MIWRTRRWWEEEEDFVEEDIWEDSEDVVEFEEDEYDMLDETFDEDHVPDNLDYPNYAPLGKHDSYIKAYFNYLYFSYYNLKKLPFFKNKYYLKVIKVKSLSVNDWMSLTSKLLKLQVISFDIKG